MESLKSNDSTYGPWCTLANYPLEIWCQVNTHWHSWPWGMSLGRTTSSSATSFGDTIFTRVLGWERSEALFRAPGREWKPWAQSRLSSGRVRDVAKLLCWGSHLDSEPGTAAGAGRRMRRTCCYLGTWRKWEIPGGRAACWDGQGPGTWSSCSALRGDYSREVDV